MGCIHYVGAHVAGLLIDAGLLKFGCDYWRSRWENHVLGLGPPCIEGKSTVLEQEVASPEFGDMRLNERLRLILDR